MSEPTPRQREIHEAIVEHGSVARAARALSLTAGAIYSGEAGYQAAIADPSTEPRKSRARGIGASARARERQAAIAATPDRLEALEERVEAFAKVLEGLSSEVGDLADGLRLFFQRQPVILAPARDALQPTHRRIADGGIGGRRESRG